MSIINKYLRNTTNSYANKINNNNSSQSSNSSSSYSSSSSSSSDQPKSMMNKPFEFKPLGAQTTNGLTLSRLANKFNNSATAISKSENLVNSLLHSTARNGKISKRKPDKSSAVKKFSNSGLIQVDLDIFVVIYIFQVSNTSNN